MAGSRLDRRPNPVGGGRELAGREKGWRVVEMDGFEILVGERARDNDELTFREAAPKDLWLHVSGYPGSHVVVRNPDELPSIPRQVVERAAGLAAWHSKARYAGGKVEVHVCRAGDVSKPRGAPPGEVSLRRWDAVRVYPKGEEEE